jgi:carboxypeptidase C (cathepsin A)
VNIYDVYSTNCTYTAIPDWDDDIKQAAAPVHRRPMSAVEKAVQLRAQERAKTDSQCRPGPYPCLTDTAMTTYFNMDSVRTALHVAAASVTGPWALCANIAYTPTEPNEPRDIYPTLINSIRVLIYNGESDGCVPWTDNEQWTSGMGLSVVKPFHPFFVGENANSVGGWVTNYDKNFTFTVVRGAGHMVPEFAPVPAFYMFANFLANTL